MGEGCSLNPAAVPILFFCSWSEFTHAEFCCDSIRKTTDFRPDVTEWDMFLPFFLIVPCLLLPNSSLKLQLGHKQDCLLGHTADLTCV